MSGGSGGVRPINGQQLELEGDENENVSLYYYITDNIKVQFGREEFCLVTGLRFGVENLVDYNDGELHIPFRRRVFPSSLDGEHITGNMVFRIIDDELFDRLNNDDVVSLYCLGILQLVLLGVEGKRRIPDWMLRLANDRVGWDNYPWGSYVWSTLYSQLKNANVRRWPKLYATQPTTEIDKKSYSIFGYTWAFKRNMPAARLTPDETEARSDWWISSRTYFDGGVYRVVPHHSRHIQTSAPSSISIRQQIVPVTFWQQLVLHLCMPGIDSNTPVGWLSVEHMNSWMELLIRNRPKNSPWTVAYTNTISVHLENQRFLIETDQHAIGTLDGSTRPYRAWNNVN
nr:phospholipase-like protein [Tanacetum cinerariifolium]